MLLKRSQQRIEASTIRNDDSAGAEERKEEVPVSPEEPEVRTGSPSPQQEPVSAIIPPPQSLCRSLVQAVPYGRVHYQVSGCSLVVGAAEGGGGGCCRRVSPGDKTDQKNTAALVDSAFSFTVWRRWGVET